MTFWDFADKHTAAVVVVVIIAIAALAWVATWLALAWSEKPTIGK